MGRNVHNTLKLKMMPSEARLKKFEIKKNKHTFYVNNHSPNIFPVLANFYLCQNKIPCVFPVWKKEEPNSLFSLCRGHPVCVISRFPVRNEAGPFRFGWLPWCLSRFSRSWPLTLPCVHDCLILLRKGLDRIVCAAPKFLSQKVTVAFQNQPAT